MPKEIITKRPIFFSKMDVKVTKGQIWDGPISINIKYQ